MRADAAFTERYPEKTSAGAVARSVLRGMRRENQDAEADVAQRRGAAILHTHRVQGESVLLANEARLPHERIARAAIRSRARRTRCRTIGATSGRVRGTPHDSGDVRTANARAPVLRSVPRDSVGETSDAETRGSVGNGSVPVAPPFRYSAASRISSVFTRLNPSVQRSHWITSRPR